MPYDESDDYDVYEIIDQAYNEADRMSRPIHLLLETYQKYEEHDPNADRVADDREALEWLDDYWEYVKWNEHGNESSIDEVGGFKGFAYTVTDSDYVEATLDYLIYEDDPELIDPTARDLADRLKIIANRYGALRKMKKMSFTERVCQYIKNNYDIPDKMEFYVGTEEYDFKDWVDAYVEEYNNNVSSPYGDDSDESDVEVVAEEILQIMTAPYKMGNEYVINYDDFEASSKKMKKSYGRYGTVEQVHDLSDNERRMYNYKVKLDWDGGSGYVYVWWRIFERDGIYNLIRLEGNGYDGLTELLKEQYFGTLDEAVEYADMQTDIIKNKMLELFGHGMDASWSDDDISSYNNFGDSIEPTMKSQDIHSLIASIRKNNNSLKKEPVGLNGNWAVSYFSVPTEHGEYLNMVQSNYFSNDVVACYEGTITAYPTSTGTNDLYAQMTYNQDTGEINGYIEWGQYTKNYVPTNARPKSKESLDVFIGEFKQFAEEFTQMIK